VVELVVVMALVGVIAAISASALFSVHVVAGRTDDESRGLSDMKIVVERLSRDLRGARGVELHPLSDQTQLVIWIDGNSDYQRVPSEVFTWKLEPGTNPGLYNVIKESGTGLQQIVGYSLISDIAFTYAPGQCVAPPCSEFGPAPTSDTNTVRVEMSYDAIPGLHSSPKYVGFKVRLRNAE
jgi:hypothetical protein